MHQGVTIGDNGKFKAVQIDVEPLDRSHYREHHQFEAVISLLRLIGGSAKIGDRGPLSVLLPLQQDRAQSPRARIGMQLGFGDRII